MLVLLADWYYNVHKWNLLSLFVDCVLLIIAFQFQEQERRRKAEVAAHSALNGPRVRAYEFAGPDFEVSFFPPRNWACAHARSCTCLSCGHWTSGRTWASSGTRTIGMLLMRMRSMAHAPMTHVIDDQSVDIAMLPHAMCHDRSTSAEYIVCVNGCRHGIFKTLSLSLEAIKGGRY